MPAGRTGGGDNGEGSGVNSEGKKISDFVPKRVADHYPEC